MWWFPPCSSFLTPTLIHVLIQQIFCEPWFSTKHQYLKKCILINWIWSCGYMVIFFFFSLGQSLQTLPNRRLKNVFLQLHSKKGKTWDVNPAPLTPLCTGLAAAYCDLGSSKPFCSSNKCIHLSKFGYHLFFSSFFNAFLFSSFLSDKPDLYVIRQIKKNPHLSNSQTQ